MYSTLLGTLGFLYYLLNLSIIIINNFIKTKYNIVVATHVTRSPATMFPKSIIAGLFVVAFNNCRSATAQRIVAMCRHNT